MALRRHPPTGHPDYEPEALSFDESMLGRRGSGFRDDDAGRPALEAFEQNGQIVLVGNAWPGTSARFVRGQPTRFDLQSAAQPEFVAAVARWRAANKV